RPRGADGFVAARARPGLPGAGPPGAGALAGGARVRVAAADAGEHESAALRRPRRLRAGPVHARPAGLPAGRRTAPRRRRAVKPACANPHSGARNRASRRAAPPDISPFPRFFLRARSLHQLRPAVAGVLKAECWGRVLSMKTTYRDPETGWSVTREAVTNLQSGVEVIEETLTDPRTGEVYHGSRAASYARPIAEWVQAIVETK